MVFPWVFGPIPSLQALPQRLLQRQGAAAAALLPAQGALQLGAGGLRLGTIAGWLIS